MMKIKVVHVVASLGIGGAERFVVDLCNALARSRRHEVYIVSLCDNVEESSFVKEIYPAVTYVSFQKGSGLSLKAMIRLTAWLKETSPHVVHSHLNSFEYLHLYRAIRSRTSFFHTIHSEAQAECPKPFFKALRKRTFSTNEVRPITISNNGRKTYREYYQLSNDVLVKNGRPPLATTKALEQVMADHKTTADEFLLVHVGRISEEKNQALLIQAVKKFNADEMMKCRLLMIGDTNHPELLSGLQKLVGDDNYIQFLGGKKNIGDYLHIADAFCLCSIREGMPISLIEAMSVGCIPVATAVGGVTEMIRDGETGFLSRDLSVASFTKTLKRCLLHSHRSTISENVRNEFEKRYHIDICAGKHLDTYNHALNLFQGNDSAFELLYKSKILNTNT